MSGIKGITNIDYKNGYRLKTDKNTGLGNTDFSSYLSETKSMDDIFEEAAKKYNVPANLLKAIGKAESNFDAKAVSKCGAQGVMQLMPKTAEYLGVKDSFDAEQNILGGAKYISELLQKYDGNTKLALAAYNAGMGNVKKYGGIPPFEETQNYVIKVTKYMNEGVSSEELSEKVPVSKSVNAGKINSIYYTSIPAPATPVISKEEAAASFEEIFSEIDYMKFIELFLEDKDEEDKEERINYFGGLR
jgi:hypothetical protein